MSVRVAIVSDIHSNLAALNAVVEHAGTVDAIWCLGDIVGYGPQPNECIAVLREHKGWAAVGNHDLAATGGMGVEEFNDAAAAAARWTAEQLTQESAAYLRALPPVVIEGDFTMVHGSLRWPEWEYLLSTEQAQAQFELQTTPYSLVGHSHLPFVFREEPTRPPSLERAPSGECTVLEKQRLIINPGSVGQPRDGDPRAGYALYDSESATVTHHRVDYDIEATQQAMRAFGLPGWLIERLSEGR
jgi:diadenosine tetraphosphatase ApaH/serine/threonine PP2A family protein phosphatase